MTLISTLDANVSALPSGAMGSGTRMAAARIVDGLRVLSEPAIRAALVAEAEHAEPGPLKDWLVAQAAS